MAVEEVEAAAARAQARVAKRHPHHLSRIQDGAHPRSPKAAESPRPSPLARSPGDRLAEEQGIRYDAPCALKLSTLTQLNYRCMEHRNTGVATRTALLARRASQGAHFHSDSGPCTFPQDCTTLTRYERSRKS